MRRKRRRRRRRRRGVLLGLRLRRETKYLILLV